MRVCVLSGPAYSHIPALRSGMISQHEAEMKELRDILYTMELRYRERETEAEHEFQGMMDELKNKVAIIPSVAPTIK